MSSTPVDWGVRRQTSVKNAAHGAELNALKLPAERGSMVRHHLRSMEVLASNPKNMHCDRKALVANTTTAGSILSKKRIALACHFCREHFSAELIDIRWIEGKHNIADVMTKALRTTECHIHINRATSTK